MNKTPIFLGVDPGLTTGLAILDSQGQLMDFHQARFDELIDWLREITNLYTVKYVIMENFITYRHKAIQLTGSKQDAAKVIGAVNVWAKLNMIPVEMQMATILPIAEKWSGQTMSGKSHDKTHWLSAYLHAFYFMHKRGLAKSILQRKAERAQEDR